jgi:hypothetical protein
MIFIKSVFSCPTSIYSVTITFVISSPKEINIRDEGKFHPNLVLAKGDIVKLVSKSVNLVASKLKPNDLLQAKYSSYYF